MAFRVGQKVVCVDARKNGWGDIPNLVEGQHYTVAGVIALRDRVGLTLVEAKIPTSLRQFYPAYQGTRFRPVVEKKTDISIFTKMLKPKEHVLCGNDH